MQNVTINDRSISKVCWQS